MNNFRRLNNLTGWVIFAIAAIVYLLTIEPTTSFWDCGEFIASSYKLEIGHAPGNPVFQIIARFFSMFTGPDHAAMMINAMSALCSAFTILFLFWSITHLSRRLMERKGDAWSLGNTIAILGAGAVGALVYTFSDSFWFSAEEAEVYAMSSLFTALVFWAILKWEEQADEPYANRWIVLIAFLMGLSVGVHLLNLLAIPAIVFVYYFKKYKISTKGIIGASLVSMLLIAVTLWGLIIVGTPNLLAYFDLFFVNTLGMPYNSGAVFCMLLIFAALAYGIYYTYKRGKVLWNTVWLSTSVFYIGFSLFAVIIIRSAANTPTNENQPDNPFSLAYYLGREQYGSSPLVSGATFASAPIAGDPVYGYTKKDGKYLKILTSMDYKYDPNVVAFFPRMHSIKEEHKAFYRQYVSKRAKVDPYTNEKIPTFRDNLSYFFDMQLNWMYWRYFMWNFAGRQNDIQGATPNAVCGNWESGIPFIDNARLGNQSDQPDYLANNKGKNHYYMLPLLLGIIGLFYQLKKDKRNFTVVTLLFILTGVAIIIYLNSTPLEPRERDYAYVGSFYAFAMWIGLGVLCLYEWLKKKLPGTVTACAVSAVCLIVPVQMGCENWDDHTRAHRYTAHDVAYNYLMSCDENAILFTNGDNDTFPLWYIQEVEGVRTDVRIVNISLLGTPWYIDQMKYQQYESAPVPFTLNRDYYETGINDFVPIDERITEAQNIKDVMNFFADPRAKMRRQNGELLSYFPVRKFIVPVDKEKVLQNKKSSPAGNTPNAALVEKIQALGNSIVSPKDSNKIVDQFILEIPKNKTTINKAEMMVLDLLANNNWERPIYFVSMGGDVDLGLRDYLQYEGFVYKLVPVRTGAGSHQLESGNIQADKMYERLKNIYKWGNMDKQGVNIDYNNILTLAIILNVREMHARTANALLAEGKKEQAIEILDQAIALTPTYNFPYNLTAFPSGANESAMISLIDLYYRAEQTEKASKLAEDFFNDTQKNLNFFVQLTKEDVSRQIQLNFILIQQLASILDHYNNQELGVKVKECYQTYAKLLGIG